LREKLDAYNILLGKHFIVKMQFHLLLKQAINATNLSLLFQQLKFCNLNSFKYKLTLKRCVQNIVDSAAALCRCIDCVYDHT